MVLWKNQIFIRNIVSQEFSFRCLRLWPVWSVSFGLRQCGEERKQQVDRMMYYFQNLKTELACDGFWCSMTTLRSFGLRAGAGPALRQFGSQKICLKNLKPLQWLSSIWAVRASQLFFSLPWIWKPFAIVVFNLGCKSLTVFFRCALTSATLSSK